MMSILNFINLLFSDPEKHACGDDTDGQFDDKLDERKNENDDYVRSDNEKKKKVSRSQLLSLECYEKIRDRFPYIYLKTISISNAVNQYI